MSNPLKLPLEGDKKNSVRCIVETPRGSRAKFKYDPDSKLFALSKELVTGLSYPYDWGFIPSTLGEDGDPVDVMLLHDVATYPGMIICAIARRRPARQRRRGRARRRPTRACSPCPSGPTASTSSRTCASCRSARARSWRSSSSRRRRSKSKEVEVLDWEGPKRGARDPRRVGGALSRRQVAAAPAMAGELVIRFVVGGVIVSLFAALGELFKPRPSPGSSAPRRRWRWRRWR